MLPCWILVPIYWTLQISISEYVGEVNHRGPPGSDPHPETYPLWNTRGLLASDLLPADRAAIDRLKRTGGGAIDGGNDPLQVFLDDAPLDRGQRDDCQPPPSEVLLKGEGLVAGDEHFKALLFGCVEEAAVFESLPTFTSGGENLMRTEMGAEPVVKVLVQQNLLGWCCAR